MEKIRNAMRVWVCILYVLSFAATIAKAQSSMEGKQKITPSVADQQAAQESNLIYRHARPANTAAGRAMKSEESGTAPSTKSTSITDSTGLRFPGDVTYLGGPVVTSAESHAIYLIPNGNCLSIANCWGNPEGFLTDLANSDFVHLLDQYTGLSGSYTVGPNAIIAYRQTPAIFTDADLQVFVHAVASKEGSGYGHIYHVFLPPGQDECFSHPSKTCYSPDNPKTFIFCAYHTSVQFKDIGHVLYSVEPFQDVPGCSVPLGTPNGQLVDSTNNSLSHELFETISDPDGNAWINFSLIVLNGAEIGDECSFFTVIASGAFFDPSVFTIGSHLYAVQPEYSNSAHACAVGP
jgi:hypothetical protein